MEKKFVIISKEKIKVSQKKLEEMMSKNPQGKEELERLERTSQIQKEKKGRKDKKEEGKQHYTA